MKRSRYQKMELDILPTLLSLSGIEVWTGFRNVCTYFSLLCSLSTVQSETKKIPLFLSKSETASFTSFTQIYLLQKSVLSSNLQNKYTLRTKRFTQCLRRSDSGVQPCSFSRSSILLIFSLAKKKKLLSNQPQDCLYLEEPLITLKNNYNKFSTLTLLPPLPHIWQYLSQGFPHLHNK